MVNTKSSKQDYMTIAMIYETLEFDFLLPIFLEYILFHVYIGYYHVFDTLAMNYADESCSFNMPSNSDRTGTTQQDPSWMTVGKIK